MSQWENWAGTATCSPAHTFEPRSEAELVDIVKHAASAGVKVRVLGSGHSFNAMNCVDNQGFHVSLKHYNQMLHIDKEALLVTFQAGIQLCTLLDILGDNGLALPNMGVIDVQTLSGAVSTGTHGSGVRHKSLSAGVCGCRLVTGTAEVLQIDPHHNPTLLPAVRIGLGCLGILSTITLRVVKAFQLHVTELPMRWDTCLDKLQELADKYEYFKAWWTPHTGYVQAFLIDPDSTKMPDISTEVATQLADPETCRHRRWLQDTARGRQLQEELFALAAEDAQVLPFINAVLRPHLFEARQASDRNDAVLCNRHYGSESDGVRFDVMEYAIPRHAAVPALKRLEAMLEELGLVMAFPVDIRFTAEENDAWLSPAYGRPVCHIGIPAKMPFRKPTDHSRLFHEFERLMLSVGGRPHWAKDHSLSASLGSPLWHPPSITSLWHPHHHKSFTNGILHHKSLKPKCHCHCQYHLTSSGCLLEGRVSRRSAVDICKWTSASSCILLLSWPSSDLLPLEYCSCHGHHPIRFLLHTALVMAVILFASSCILLLSWPSSYLLPLAYCSCHGHHPICFLLHTALVMAIILFLLHSAFVVAIIAQIL